MFTIERTKVATFTAKSDADAVRHAERAMAAPDPRWRMATPVVVARRGSQRTVRVKFTLEVE